MDRGMEISEIQQTASLGKAIHEIKTLNGLTAGTLAEIILGTGKDETTRPLVDHPPHVHEIRPHHILRIGKTAFAENSDKGTFSITLLHRHSDAT